MKIDLGVSKEALDEYYDLLPQALEKLQDATLESRGEASYSVDKDKSHLHYTCKYDEGEDVNEEEEEIEFGANRREHIAVDALVELFSSDSI